MKNTKQRLLFLMVGFLQTVIINAQTVKSIKDPYIVSQEKRQVISKWGEWRPGPDYFLGINTNVHNHMVWGFLAPSRNRAYKRGQDIRPLSPTGLQNQRLGTTLMQQNATRATRDEVEDIESTTLDEYMHITALTTEADPLYLLYYKSMLKPLKEQEGISLEEKEYYLQKMGMSLATIRKNDKYGLLNKLVIDIVILLDKYKMARTVDMPRGKRIIMYHECLIDWRKKEQYIVYLERQTKMRESAMLKLDKLNSYKKNNATIRQRKDVDIFIDVLMGHQQTF